MEPMDDVGNTDTYYRMGMSDDDFRAAAKDMTEFVVKYYSDMKGQQAFPSVKPGYMKELLPGSAPFKSEKWDSVFKDLDKIALLGLTHWPSSRFFAFYPSSSSYPSILAEMLSASLNSIGFSWNSSPASTELETIVLDWLAKAIGLPECFIYNGTGPGCGVIQGSASEATIMTVLAARTRALRRLSEKHPECTKHELLSKLVMYTSEYSHSSVERAGLIAMVHLHKVPVDDTIAVRGASLSKAMANDLAEGKIPFYVCATLGTTDCASFDDLAEIAEVCDEDMWIHVDAAYAGSSFICPEFRGYMNGIEKVTSFNFNPHKWLMVNYDFSALWVRNSLDLINSLHVNLVCLGRDQPEITIDYRHCQLPFGRRFRSLKLWFVMRIFGIDNLRKRIREDVKHAKIFENLVREDDRFRVCFPVRLGLVCICLVSHANDREKNNQLNEKLLHRVVESRDIYLIGSKVRGQFFLRVCTGSVACDEDAMRFAWASIQKHATAILSEQ